MIPLNYHHLYYFWTTAKTGSVSSAAKELYLSQPALSAQLKELEKSMDQKLLERGRRGVSLTPAGKVAFAYCERIFENGQALLQSLKSETGGQRRPIRLGMVKSAPRRIALNLLDCIEHGPSSVQPAIFTGTVEDLIERLSRHSLEVAICDEDVSSRLGPGFRCRAIGESPTVFAAAPRLKKSLGFIFSGAKPVPMLLRTQSNPLRWDVEQFLRARKIPFSIMAETDDPDLIRILALRGKGVAALSLASIKEDLAAGRLCDVYGKPTKIKRRFWLCASAHPSPDALIQKATAHIMSNFVV